MRRRKPKRGEKCYRLGVRLDVVGSSMMSYGKFNRAIAASKISPQQETEILAYDPYKRFHPRPPKAEGVFRAG